MFSYQTDEGGFTLIELVLVIVIIGMMASMMSGQVDVVQGWRVKSGLRQLIRTWEIVYNDSVTKNYSYRLVLDLDSQSYYVRREVVLGSGRAQQVDLIKNLRTRKEKERRAKKELNEMPSIEEEFNEEDAMQGQDLDKIFFAHIFLDPESGFDLKTPLSFPELGESTPLPEGLLITGVKVRGRTEEQGQPFIRVSGRNGSEFAVVYVRAGDQEFSLLNDPGGGTFLVKSGHIDFEWMLGKK